MQEQILSLVETLDEARKNVLAHLESLTESQLSFRPDDTTWSPLDIAEHCVMAECSLFANMPEPEACVHVSPTLRNRLNLLKRRYILKWRIPVLISTQAMQPQGKLSLGEIAASWGDHMVWLRGYIEKTSPESQKHACFRHPIAGPLTLNQALDMAILHVGYHLPMLEARIKTARKTAC